MGSLKSKLFTNEIVPNADENASNLKNASKDTLNNSNQVIVNSSNEANKNNEQYVQVNRPNKTVNPNMVPKSQYFRSLRPNTKKQYSTINNKIIHNSSSSKLFVSMANVLRSKSHSEVNRKRYNRQSIGKSNSKESRTHQESKDKKIDEKIELNENPSTTDLITNQLQSTSIVEPTTEEKENHEEEMKTAESVEINDKKEKKNSASTTNKSIETENVENCAVISSVSDSTSNCYYTEEDDYEWDNKNKQNDDLIASFKQQIESLNKQLEAIGKEDLKLISELSMKIEKLSKMNHVRNNLLNVDLKETATV